MTVGNINNAVLLAGGAGFSPWPSFSLTYSFMASLPTYYNGRTVISSAATPASFSADFSPYSTSTSGHQATYNHAVNVLNALSEFTGLGFSLSTAGAGDIEFGFLAGTNVTAGGWASAGSNDHYFAEAGDIWFRNAALIGNGAVLVQGGVPDYGWNLVPHELGHSLGLQHSHQGAAGGPPIPGLSYIEDSQKYTIMSYNGLLWRSVYEYQLYDIAALQYMYGARIESENTTYDVSDFTESIALYASTARYRAIWDGGGDDHFDASDFADSVYIDLRPGYFSSIGPLAQVQVSGGTLQSSGIENISIAFGTYIERATGTSFDDVIVGSAYANEIDGGAGNDVLVGSGAALVDLDAIVGGAGITAGDGVYDRIDVGAIVAQPVPDGTNDDDVLFGGTGDDWLLGGAGDDTLLGGVGSDIIVGGAGSDLATYDPNIGVFATLRFVGQDAALGGLSFVSVESGSGGGGDLDRLRQVERILLSEQRDVVTVAGPLERLDFQTRIDAGASVSGSVSTELADTLSFETLDRGAYLETSGDFDAVQMFNIHEPFTQPAVFILNAIIRSGPVSAGGFSDPLNVSFTNFETIIGSSHGDIMSLRSLNPGGAVSFGDQAIIDAAAAMLVRLGTDPAAAGEAMHQRTLAAGAAFANQVNVQITGGAGDDAVVGSVTGRVAITGDGGDDVLYAGGFVSDLYGGADNDQLYGDGFQSNLHGGAGQDTFHLSTNSFAMDATTEDFVTWGGNFVLTGGVQQWWMEDGWAYWTPFTSIISASPLALLGPIGLIGAILDAPMMTSFRFGLSETNQLIVQSARGRGGQAIVENYDLDLASGLGTGNITVFAQTFGEGSIAGLQQYIKLALRAGFGLTGQGTDPLVLDLDGDGLELTQAEQGVHFDLDGDGFAERMGWTRGGDGFLVRDLNNNGTVDGIGEMFGNETTSGFAHLAAYDSNQDGLISSADTGFANLKVWVDADGDGITDAGELLGLTAAGIASISLAASATNTVVSGNQVRAQAVLNRIGGGTSTISDVVLGSVSADTVWRGDATISSAAAATAGLRGFGHVVDLRIAMTDDPILLGLVEDFADLPATTGWQMLLAKAAEVAFQWAGVEDVAATDLGGVFDMRKLAFLETYLGTELAPRASDGSVIQSNLQELVEAWDGALSKIALRLAAQGPLEAIFETAPFDLTRDTFVLEDANALAAVFEAAIAALPSGGEAAAWAATWGPLLAIFGENAVRADRIPVRVDYIVQGLVQALDGTNGALGLQTLVDGMSLDGVRIGTTGTDALARGTSEGLQVYVGGGGSDTLTGGKGQDVYVFGRDFGQDTVVDSEGLESGDRVRLALYNADEVTFARVGLDLVIQVIGSTDKITIKNQFSTPIMHTNGMQLSPDYGIEDIQFADGTIWQAGDIAAAIGRGTSGADTIDGTGIADEIEGGLGNDLLRGGDSGDLYYYSRGDGNDVVQDVMGNPLLSGADVLLFLSGISLENLRFSRDGDSTDLLISFGWAGDSITLKDQFGYTPLGFQTRYATDNRIEALMFATGIGMNWLDIQAAVIQTYTTSGADQTYGFGTADQFYSSAGDDFISGLDGGDTYRFDRGSGHDVIHDDSLYAQSIATSLVGYEGWGADDVLVFGAGISLGDLTFTRSGAAPDLLISVAGSTDTLTIRGQFAHTPGDIFGILPTMWFDRIEQFRFADGSSLSYAQVVAMVTTGTATSESLYGVHGADRLDGKAGNDLMVGADGGDTYVFGRGYGSDTVHDRQADPFTPASDRIEFKADVAFADVIFSRDGSDLLVTIVGTTDVLRIKDQYLVTETGPFGAQAFDQIEQFVWSDGTVRTWDVVAAKIIADSRTTGNDLVLGTHFNDRLDGGVGNDRLEGGNGADTYVFEAGGGHDTIRDDWTNILSGNGDAITFGSGLLSTNLTLTRYGTNLENLTLTFTTGEQLSVEGQFFYTTINYPRYQIETFNFADQSWTSADLRVAYIASKQTSNADVIDGFHTDDFIEGGAGNDVLRGGDGSDTYVFKAGFGQDVIEETVNLVTYADRDVVRFGPGLTAANAILTRDGDDLVISFAGSSDSLRITDQFVNSAYYGGWHDIERIEFDGGTVWTDADVRVALLQQAATAGADTITGFYTSDILNGGAGNDILRGAGGGDTYVFGKGSGADRIQEGYSTVYEDQADTVAFAANVAPSEVTFSRVGNDLVIAIAGVSDTLTIEGQFGTASSLVERFRFSNGVTYTAAQVASGVLVTQSTSGNDVITGTSANELFEGGAGNDTLRGRDGNDTYQFDVGFGQDVIEESVDNVSITDVDVVQFGAGLTSDRAIFSRDGDSLIIGFSGSTDTLRLSGQFTHGAFYPGWSDVESFRFADGVVLSDADIRLKLLAQSTTSSNDTITGFWGSDTIEGGAGNDLLRGQGGGDTYIWGRRVGSDTIEEYYASVYEDQNDVVSFLPNVTRGDVTFLKSGDDLLISIAGETGTLRVRNHFFSDIYRVDSFVFADGVLLTEADVDILAVLSQASAGNDVITGTNGADVINGLAGNDTLRGADGEDRYVFSEGFGQDVIQESVGNVSISERDTIEFGGDYSSALAILSRAGDDLIIGFQGRADTVRIQGQFGHGAWYPSWTDVEVIKFADGVIWTDEDIRERLIAASQTSGNDAVDGYFTDDSLDGGTGNDLMQGRGGSDTYLFERGDGQDIIRDVAAQLYEDTDDVLVFGRSITAADVTFIKEGNDLRVRIAGGTDEILIKDQFNLLHSGIEIFRFSDGTVLAAADVATRAIERLATLGNDIIGGTSSANILDGLAGQDDLSGRAGADVYVFGRGYGSDLIIDNGDYSSASIFDEIRFKAGVTADDLTLRRFQNDLVIRINGTDDELIIRGQFTPDNNTIERFSFADGSVYTHTDVAAFVTAPSLTNVVGTMRADTINGTTGTDTLTGGRGADLLQGGNGVDTYVYATGDGSDVINDQGASTTQIDVLQLTNLNVSQIYLRNVGADLLITVMPTGDVIEVNEYVLYAVLGYGVDQITFADASTWTRAQMNAAAAATIVGTTGADTVTGTAANNTLIGDLGNDVITGGDGTDTVVLNAASTGVRFVRQADGRIVAIQDANGETDTLSGVERIYFVSDRVTADLSALVAPYGTAGNDDWIAGTAGDDFLYGNDGDDNLHGGAGNDGLIGGAGEDIATYFGASTDFQTIRNADGTVSVVDLTGAEGSDTLTGIEYVMFNGNGVWRSIDALVGQYGTSSSDGWIDGTSGVDHLYGLAGDDTLIGRGGNDRIDGGDGYDQVNYNGLYSTFTFSRRADGAIIASDGTLSEGTDALIGVEAVYFNGDATWVALDSIVADYGTVGSDPWIDGRSGSDNLFGLSGGDTLIGRAGDDLLYGGDGFDQANYFGSSTDFSFVLNPDGTVTVTDLIGGEGEDILDNIEALYFDGDETWMTIEDALGQTALGISASVSSAILYEETSAFSTQGVDSQRAGAREGLVVGAGTGLSERHGFIWSVESEDYVRANRGAQADRLMGEESPRFFDWEGRVQAYAFPDHALHLTATWEPTEPYSSHAELLRLALGTMSQGPVYEWAM